MEGRRPPISPPQPREYVDARGNTRNEFDQVVERAAQFTGVESLNKDTLRSLSERAAPAEQQQARFGREVTLSAEEIQAAQALAGLTKHNLDQLIQQEPLWPEFVRLLQERRGKVGSFNEENCLIEDPTATTVTVEMVERETGDSKIEIPGLQIPSRLKHLYVWSHRLLELSETLRQMGISDNDGHPLTHGRSSRPLGTVIRDLYRFNKELTTPLAISIGASTPD